MTLVAKEFFEHVDSFMDYRKTIYEVSDQTIKSNMVDLRLFKGFIKRNKHEKITGPIVMDFQYYLTEAFQLMINQENQLVRIYLEFRYTI